jgi:transcriptional regulator with XRE-family HTH domain
MAKSICRIRKYRKAAHLSQFELARLLGLRSQGAMSDIESGRKRPGITIALACEIVLGLPIRELYPNVAEQVVRDVRARTGRLHEVLQSRNSRAASKKSVASIMARLDGHLDP